MTPTKNRPRPRRRPADGVTLLELLVVIMIIGVMLSIGLSKFNWGAGVSSALPVVEARVSEARSLSLGRQARVRLVIHADPTDADNPDRYLRYMDLAVEERDEDGVLTGEWVPLNSHGYLPLGVFFDAGASTRASALVATSNPPPDGSSVTGFGSWAEGAIEFSGLPQGPQACYYFEFNVGGICIHEGSTEPGGAVVLSRGVPQDGSEPLLDKVDKAGLVIWRKGTTSIFRNTRDLIELD